MTGTDLHTLTGAYAVGALTRSEAEEFRRHMGRCEACAREVRELRETAARLALAVAEVPPAGLRHQVMSAVGGTRQLPPEVNVTPLRSARRLRWRRRLPYAAAAACLAVAGVAGGVAVDAQNQADSQHRQAVRAEQQATELSALTAAPDATFHTGALKGGGTATVVSSRALDRAAVLFHGLPALPRSQVYELWYSHHGTMVPAGLVAQGRSAGATVLTGSQAAADGVGITAEPHGGSTSPTSPPLALLPV
ncbi:anti-sigma factor [Actinacidiphila rubida]|uniref:Regulator of SigK n=1 Tax=Actinacidiphila rubida TaxID=310780 RepID=A0A1H8JJE2_9ACTN|nr:anti-sigma factor [Actinacidiphila rubida]SEN80860.1 Anti-sigma-K factor rskA [Actinacidiphila rubida]